MLVKGAELVQVTVRLLEVVPLDLLVFNGALSVPVDLVRPIGVALMQTGPRALQQSLVGRVADKDEIQEVLAILRDKEIHIDRQTWNRRYRGFMEKIKSGSLFEVAEVFRDLYRLKGLKPLSFGERRMLDTARGLIVQELSVARSSDERNVEQELEKLIA